MTHANFPDALVPPHPPAHALLDNHILSYASITPTDRQRLVQGSSTRCGFWWETRNLRGPPKRKPPPSIARSPAWEKPKSQQYPQAATSPNNIHRPPPYRLPSPPPAAPLLLSHPSPLRPVPMPGQLPVHLGSQEDRPSYRPGGSGPSTGGPHFFPPHL